MKKIMLLFPLIFLLLACETGTKYKKNEHQVNNDNRDENSRNNDRSFVSTGSIEDLIGENIPKDRVDHVESYVEDDGYVFEEEANLEAAEEILSKQHFEGGVISDGLNVKRIREGKHDDYMRLVFDVYTWSAYGSQKEKVVKNVGSYGVDYDPSKRLITMVLDGYRSFTAPFPQFSSSSIVEKIYFSKHLDDSGIKLNIKLKSNAKVRVFDLKSPARMVFDIKKI